MAATLLGWHKGERIIQRRLDFERASAQSFYSIQTAIPPQHQLLLTSRIPFLPTTTLDTQGRPWGSILAASSGKPGFIRAGSEYSQLVLNVETWEGDPFEHHVTEGRAPLLTASIGIEFSTRRRNKLAGSITRVERNGNSFSLTLNVNQAIGNCPKYINIRDLIPHKASPRLEVRNLELESGDGLPEKAIKFIHSSDTVFVGSSYVAPVEDALKYPSHVGMNQRGGLPGFVRVNPGDKRTVVLPDFSGNRYMTSLGNIEITHVASFTFVDFASGDILYLTGEAKTLTGPEAHAIMPFQPTLTTLFTTGFSFVRDALPVRQRGGTDAQSSPYSPPVRHLADETPQRQVFDLDDQVAVKLTGIEILSPSIAIFAWETTRPVRILPGQAAVMDFKSLLGAVRYQHMAQLNPTSVNDDRIRTWTVSSFHKDETTGFKLTIRAKEGGAITGALFAIANKLKSTKPELLRDARPLDMTVKLVGIIGEFVLDEQPRDMLWIAGGIGVTPFLSMLKGAASRNASQPNIRLLLSTREPDIILPLIAQASPDSNKIHVDVFSSSYPFQLDSSDMQSLRTMQDVRRHAGRLPSTFLRAEHVKDRDVYVCGPPAFEKEVLGVLEKLGVRRSDVHTEGFNY